VDRPQLDRHDLGLIDARFMSSSSESNADPSERPTDGSFVGQPADVREALALLSATMEATADGLLVVDDIGRIRMFNAQFAQMWRIPGDVLRDKDDEEALSFVVDQLADPESFLAKVHELYAAPGAESFDVLEFKDGRVFERFSKPLRVNDRVVGRVWSFRDVSERKQLEEQLHHQAFHDPLTGLANKTLFVDRVEHAVARSGRATGRLVLLYMDLDNFKTVNDTLGHAAGDSLLVAVTDRLLECVREADTLARLGGDEFALLIEDAASEADAIDVANRILNALEESFSIADRDLTAGISIGIAFCTAGLTGAELIANADRAMYAAKRRGRGRYELSATPSEG